MSYLRRAAQELETPPQTKPLNERQVANSAGGYSFAVDEWKRLDRFLVLGSEGGSYYASERELTIQNLEAVKRCVAVDGPRVVARIVEISDQGRAPKNDPALMALAYAASKGDIGTRALALAALPKVARISTHLFHFVAFIRQFRGWGRGLRTAVTKWYTERTPEKLAEQVTKYQQRDGWSHRDIFRLRHINFAALSPIHQAVAKWVVKGEASDALPELIQGHIELQTITTPLTAASLIRKYGLVRESVPTGLLKESVVWEALLEKMPLTAMIRNLGNMSKCGLLAPMSDASKTVAQRLLNAEALQKARIHPIQLLIAACTYGAGHGMKGSGEWKVVPQIVDALDDAFYLAFKNVVPANKRFYLALDVSGSMGGGEVAGTFLTPRTASAAMALVTARTEPEYYAAGFQDQLVQLPLTAKTTLQDAVKHVSRLAFGSTDCSLPMLDALNNNLKIDTFVVYTDSETWAGSIHPVQALNKYRQKTGIPAKLIVVGMVSNGFTIADPNDAGMLDVVGFDSAAPSVMADFARD